MKEIAFNSFKSSMKELQLLEHSVNNEKTTKEELQNNIQKARDLLFNSYSSLSIFTDTIKKYVSVGYGIKLFEKRKKKKISKTEAKLIYSQLIQILNTEFAENSINLRKEISLENQAIFMGLTLYSPEIGDEIIEFDKSLNLLEINETQLQEILVKYVEEIKTFIEEILFYDIFLIFDRPVVTYTNEIIIETDYKKEYIDKWLNHTVTLYDIIRNKRINHWEEFYNLDLDNDEIVRLGDLQKQFFDEFISDKVKSELLDINDLEKEIQFAVVNNNINLIEYFLSGDTSKTTIKRLKNIIRFSKPKDVLIEYDNLLRDRLLFDNYNIYRTKSSKFSSTLIAGFFLKYIEALKIFLESTEFKQVQGDQIPNTTIKNCQSFKYIHFDTNPDAIKNLRDSLVKNKFIDENTQLTDFKKVFSGGEINNKITWIGYSSELSHFIKNLIKNKKNIEYLKLKHWEVTKNCFVMADESELTNKKLKGAKTPASIQLIKNALKSL